MARSGPRRVARYGDRFKATAATIVTLEQILELMQEALLTAPRTFEEVANGTTDAILVGAERMPESWAVSSVMNAAHAKGLVAVPEVRVTVDLETFESGNSVLSGSNVPKLLKDHAKIDLLIGTRSPSSSRIKLCIAAEIKGPKSNWNAFRKDLDRLRELRNLLREKGQATVFAYVTAPLSEEQQEAEHARLAKEFSVPRSAFVVKSVPWHVAKAGPTYSVSLYMFVESYGEGRQRLGR